MNLTDRILLMQMKMDILKLRANDHDWQCYIPQETKNQLLEMAKDIDDQLSNNDDVVNYKEKYELFYKTNKQLADENQSLKNVINTTAAILDYEDN